MRKLAAEADCQITTQLGSKGDSTLTTTKNGQDALHIGASTRWGGDDVGFIIEHCCEDGNLALFLDQHGEDGHKSLRAACNTVQSHESVRLVEAKAKLDGRDGAGYTPLDTCKQLPAEPVVENNPEPLKVSTGFRYGLPQHGIVW